MSSIRDLGGPQSGRVGGGQRGAALQARHRLEELNHFVGAEDDRQLTRFSRIGNAFRDQRLAERNAVEKPQRTDDLVQRRP
jgi:hypothetical protein